MKTVIKAIFWIVLAMVIWNWFVEPSVIIVDGDASGWLVLPVLAFVGLAVIMAIFGTLVAILCGIGLAVLRIFAVGLSIFWPVLLILAIGYWLFKPDKSANI
jgi:hypothetical protein